MTKSHREMLSILFSFLIILATGLVVREFILPFVWAGIIAIASWSLYERWHRLWHGYDVLASLSLVTVMTLTIAVPLLWLTLVVTNELQILTKYLITVNQQGVSFPVWMQYLPSASYLQSQWDKTLGQPHGLAGIISSSTHLSVKPFTGIIKSFGSQLVHRSVAFGFTLMCLFFFYKDGHRLIIQINAMGRHFLEERWERYSVNLPKAINATINGLVLVGIGIGVVMGLAYTLVEIPAPAVFGAITGVLAMIPFAVILAFSIVTILLLIEGKLLAAIVIISVGSLVMFVADHFVRPSIIGGATRLPFLAVLFGILGGVKLFGLVGLFIGPIVMALFITLWHEADCFKDTSAVRSSVDITQEG